MSDPKTGEVSRSSRQREVGANSEWKWTGRLLLAFCGGTGDSSSCLHLHVIHLNDVIRVCAPVQEHICAHACKGQGSTLEHVSQQPLTLTVERWFLTTLDLTNWARLAASVHPCPRELPISVSPALPSTHTTSQEKAYLPSRD